MSRYGHRLRHWCLRQIRWFVAQSALSYETSTHSRTIFSNIQAEPGADAARAATAAANRALEALEARAENALARVLGPNVAVEGAQREILLANHELLAAVGQEAAIVERAAFLGRWSSRLFKLGLVCAQCSDCNRHGKI